MSINFWRAVRGTDEGCCEYQCLKCYKTWEGRNNPEWSGWSFCPYCGTKWEGKHECFTHGEKWWTEKLYRERGYGWARKAPSFFWLIEIRELRGVWESDRHNPRVWGAWKQHDIYEGRYSAKHISEFVKRERERADADDFNNDWYAIKPQTEFRVRIIKQLPWLNASYTYFYGNNQ